MSCMSDAKSLLFILLYIYLYLYILYLYFFIFIILYIYLYLYHRMAKLLDQANSHKGGAHVIRYCLFRKSL